MTRSGEPFFAWPGWRHLRFAAFVSLLGVMWFILVYGGCDALTAHRTTRVRIHLDAELEIPFVPEFVLVYMSIYLLFVAAPFILRERKEFLSLAMSLNIAVLIAGIGFLLIPGSLGFQPPRDLGAYPKLFRFADQLNLTYNLVPSLHVALSVVCISAYARRVRTIGRILLWSWAAAIALSTLLTHQHHVIDVITGWALAVFVARLSVIPITEPSPKPALPKLL